MQMLTSACHCGTTYVKDQTKQDHRKDDFHLRVCPEMQCRITEQKISFQEGWSWTEMPATR